MFKILPQPNKIEITSKKTAFTLSKDSAITPLPLTEDFCAFIKKSSGFELKKENAEQGAVILRISDDIADSEAYTLAVQNSCVYISAGAENGLFYGLQTLGQLLLQSGGKLPEMKIEDKPLYKYRGFMLDSGRYFYTVDEVKRFIDLAAMHKLNVFHWHLTEDQGWRIEIKKYPLLTEKGSKRSHTNFGVIPRGGFYTQNEAREIVAYCRERFIRVIPEFDIPGHTVSALACYPELGCFGRDLKVATHWGVKHDIMCAGKESTYNFVFDVLEELLELFPDEYIHIGGDEAFKARWKVCPHCQALMKKEGIESEEELQHFFMSRVNAWLRERGRTSVMWNFDGLESTELLDPSIMWQLCGANRENGIVDREAARGRQMIYSDAMACYLDLPYGTVNLENSYKAAPEEFENVLGVEAALWTEYVPTVKKADYMCFPRLGAIAEIAWSAQSDRDYERFLAALPEYYKLLDVYGVGYAKPYEALPGKFRAKCSSAWFGRRVLHWQGLHNLIDDAAVKMKYGNRI